jgi:hypothetical protein
VLYTRGNLAWQTRGISVPREYYSFGLTSSARPKNSEAEQDSSNPDLDQLFSRSLAWHKFTCEAKPGFLGSVRSIDQQRSVPFKWMRLDSAMREAPVTLEGIIIRIAPRAKAEGDHGNLYPASCLSLCL